MIGWVSFYLYIAALVAALLVREHRSTAICLTAVWAFLTTTSYYLDNVTQMYLAVIVDFVAGLAVFTFGRGKTSGIVIFFFIPMILGNTIQIITGVLSPWNYFYLFAALSWAQIIGYFIGVCLDGDRDCDDSGFRRIRLRPFMAFRKTKMPRQEE